MSADPLRIAIRFTAGAFDLAVDETVSLDGVTALFGPSGAGKSTLLRIIAGLERRARGVVALGDAVWTDSDHGLFRPAHQRPVGMVFQDGRLFPHLSVAGNLRYADRRSRARQPNAIAFDDVIDALDLTPLLERRPHALSGGERQRVALGRALLTRPELLLLDEPLSALDVGRKAEILPYLADAPRRFGLPALYVSHAVEEVAQIADDMVVLSAGRVVAKGPATAVLERLDLQPVIGRFEAGVVLTARVRDHDEAFQLTRLDLDGLDLTMPIAAGLAPGDAVRVRVRARDVALATRRPEGISIRNILPGTVETITPEADAAFAEVFVAVGANRVRARVTRAAVAELGLESGAAVFALIKSVSFDRRVLRNAL